MKLSHVFQYVLLFCRKKNHSLQIMDWQIKQSLDPNVHLSKPAGQMDTGDWSSVYPAFAHWQLG